MATVYLAEEPRHSRHLAVKILRAELAATIAKDRFLREIRTLASLTHPHILPLFDSGEADGLPFFVMPYVEGETLRHRLKRERQLPIADAIQIATEVADALSFAHGRGIIHRDIKPENILLEAGHAVVADFGVAKAITVAAGEKITSLGFAIGTPQYMSPEQATADPSVDGRSDLYSLACVLFEMLSGEPPFAGCSPHELFSRKLIEIAPPIGAARNGVLHTVEVAIARALRPAPSERYDTMLEFSDALNASRLSANGNGIDQRIGVAGRDLPRGPIEMRPLDAELDIYGLTHPGKKERINQDHFLMCSIRREMHFHQTSLPDDSHVPRKGERRAFIGIVADGMGRGTYGEQASRNAIEVLTQQLMHSVSSFAITTEDEEATFVDSLYSMALQCQLTVEQRSWEAPEAHGSGFELTAWIGMWPRGFVIEIGSGKIFQLVDGNFFRLSGLSELDERTRSQMLEASGAVIVTPTDVKPPAGHRPRHMPVIYRHPQKWNSIGVICSRGLTENVSEALIAKRLAETTSAKHACETLLADALDAGGTENITVLVGRSVQTPA